ncbi:hypothetical protein SEVIR_3G356300v4 [Setaria viridis]|uniref:Jacalin-type lectin domain-containing protein n=1 Tax=Setaria viridis TaxID=4556 RepID=A0A4U6VH80_SETVI|nr:protein GOS9-like [Setaria viridis]TKW28858.1 hypothetical protein SEVIR_3G356300v2 [Setaria viridis]
MNSVVKIGPFGSTSFAEGDRDITVAPQRLQSITIRHGHVVDAVAFTYKDSNGLEHTTGQWGGNGGNSTTITLEPYEFVKEVHGLYGFYGYGSDGITNFTIVTNLRTYGPFGLSKSIKEPKSFDIPVTNNGSIVGFFSHCNKGYVTAIGFYIKPF